MADQPKPAASVSYTPVPRPMTEREIARERLRASVDALAHEANLQVQLQREPLKMLGGASAVGAVIGLVVGRQFRRSKKIYVDAGSPTKHQKALIKAQHKQQSGKGVGGALVATLGTLAVRTLTERVITPKLEELAGSMQHKASQPKSEAPKAGQARAAATAGVARPVPGSVAANTLAASTAMTATPAAAASVTGAASPATSFLKPAPVHPGVVPVPESQVEAKVAGSEIAPDERANPNLR
ncbi:hypothetical protein [Deinococcus hohokamensis]|uniref:DUF3618 domain-containing protein n=1 Tax=Deinococcus hohokamensis TaxID=309883 RepID=A0ABV9I598_9DEIO